jgi:transcriptional antiterminator RfaH
MPELPPPQFPEGPHWFCLSTKRFCEHLCGSTLQQELDVEIFCPLIRFERARGSKKIWVNEALFPNYFFAHFDFSELGRRVLAVRGVRKVVSFGGNPHPVPYEVIDQLRGAVNETGTIVVPASIQPGETVRVLDGPFKGVRALVTRVMPGRDRVAILLEMLGAEREVEVPGAAVISEARHPLS